MTLELCRLPRRPSELYELRRRGVSAEACLDFDKAFIEFDWWIKSKQNETVMKEPPKHQGKVPMPKYPNLGAILAEYDTSVVPGQAVEAQIAAQTEIDEIVSEFAASMEPEF